MELERPVGDGIIAVTAALVKGVGGNHVVDFVVAHHAFTQDDEPAEDSSDEDQRDDQMVNSESGPKRKNRAIQPGVDSWVQGHSGFFYMIDRVIKIPSGLILEIYFTLVSLTRRVMEKESIDRCLRACSMRIKVESLVLILWLKKF